MPGTKIRFMIIPTTTTELQEHDEIMSFFLDAACEARDDLERSQALQSQSQSQSQEEEDEAKHLRCLPVWSFCWMVHGHRSRIWSALTWCKNTKARILLPARALPAPPVTWLRTTS